MISKEKALELIKDISTADTNGCWIGSSEIRIKDKAINTFIVAQYAAGYLPSLDECEDISINEMFNLYNGGACTIKPYMCKNPSHFKELPEQMKVLSALVMKDEPNVINELTNIIGKKMATLIDTIQDGGTIELYERLKHLDINFQYISLVTQSRKSQLRSLFGQS